MELRSAEPVRRVVSNAESDVRSIPASDAAPVFNEAGLDEPNTVEAQWFSDRPVSKASRVQITGPSFLGLGEPSAEEEANVTYLYEDESSGGHARFWIAAVMTIALIALVGYEWYRNPGLSHGIADRISQIWNVNTVKSPPPSVAAPPIPPAPQAVVPDVPKNETETTATESSAVNQAKVPETSATPESPAAGVSGRNEATTDEGSTETTAPDRGSEHPQSDLRGPAKRTSPATGLAERRADAGAAALAQADNYLYGRGVVKSCSQALDYLRKAADQGSAGARSKLGGLYATGNCVPLDRVRAYNWFVRARQAGDHNVWIDQNMTMLWQAMNSEEKARAIGTH